LLHGKDPQKQRVDTDCLGAMAVAIQTTPEFLHNSGGLLKLKKEFVIT
jgi:hypothetical protein